MSVTEARRECDFAASDTLAPKSSREGDETVPKEERRRHRGKREGRLAAALPPSWPETGLLLAAERHLPDALRVRRRVEHRLAARGPDAGRDARGRLHLEV